MLLIQDTSVRQYHQEHQHNPPTILSLALADSLFGQFNASKEDQFALSPLLIPPTLTYTSQRIKD